MSGEESIADVLYEHFTVEEILSDLEELVQRLSDYASQAERLRQLVDEGKVNAAICEDFLVRIGEMAELARKDAEVLRFAAIKKIKNIEVEFFDLQRRKEALEIRYAMNKISKEDYEKALNDAMKRHEENKSRTTILDRLSGAIDERFSRIEDCIKGKSSKRGLVEVPKPVSNLERQAQDSELAKAIQEKPLICTTCGSANPASAIYCWNCKTSLIKPVVKEEFTGAKVEEETPRFGGDAKTHLDALKLISCPKCGSENLALAPFCYNCKARLATLNNNLEKSEPIIKS